MITITVAYRLHEYLEIVRDFLPIALARHAERKGKTFKGAKWYHSLSLYLLAPPAFFYKRSRVGDCTFEIDEYGIRRTSKTGLKTIEWENVRHVQKLSSAYLIELNEGSLPIPYRCFNAEEQDLFSSYIASEKPNKFENENAASGTGVVKTRRPF